MATKCAPLIVDFSYISMRLGLCTHFGHLLFNIDHKRDFGFPIVMFPFFAVIG